MRPFREVFVAAPEIQVPVSICQTRRVAMRVLTATEHLWRYPGGQLYECQLPGNLYNHPMDFLIII